jgi:AcrR family transcriptional regulator
VAERLTRQEQRRQNRLNLLVAAEKVFAERGIQGASLDEVAAAAGLTKGAVYSNFASKEDLVLEVMCHRMSEEAQAQADRLLCADQSAERLVAEFGAYWAETVASGRQEFYQRVTQEFMTHALRHPAAREQLVAMLFPAGNGDRGDRHPLAPPGSELANLPPQQAEAILKALDIGMSMLAVLAPEQCPPSLFPVALRLLTGLPSGS